MPNCYQRLGTRIAYLLLAVLAVTSSGCLAAAIGVAAGGAAAGGYAYYKGRINRDYAANLDDAWAATHTALKELGMPILKDNRDNTGGSVESQTADGESVLIDFELLTSRIPAEGAVTRVGVRVGRFSFGDEVVSERILNQVGAHLVPMNRTVAAAPAGQTAPPPLLPPEPTPATTPNWTAPTKNAPGH